MLLENNKKDICLKKLNNVKKRIKVVDIIINNNKKNIQITNID